MGYLLKQRIAGIPTICADIEQVYVGGTVLDPEVVALMVARTDREYDTVRWLTQRRREVLALMAEVRSNAATAHRSPITEKAVVQHVSHIYDEHALPPSDDDHRRVLAVINYLTR